MKKLFWIIPALILASCAAPKNSVTGFSYDGQKACIKGKLTIYSPTSAQLDSVINAIKQNLIDIQHTGDSANAHFFNYTLCSPILNQTK